VSEAQARAVEAEVYNLRGLERELYGPRPVDTFAALRVMLKPPPVVEPLVCCDCHKPKAEDQFPNNSHRRKDGSLVPMQRCYRCTNKRRSEQRKARIARRAQGGTDG